MRESLPLGGFLSFDRWSVCILSPSLVLVKKTDPSSATRSAWSWRPSWPTEKCEILTVMSQTSIREFDLVPSTWKTCSQTLICQWSWVCHHWSALGRNLLEPTNSTHFLGSLISYNRERLNILYKKEPANHFLKVNWLGKSIQQLPISLIHWYLSIS